jgi:hypothetical protein
MIDINYPLRKAYYAALQATGLPVYYQSLPNNINPDNYIVFRSINSNDASTKTSSDTLTTITVEIHTVKDVANQGLAADDIAGQVYTYIYAISQFALPMSGVQMVTTELSNDTVQDFQISAQVSYISRFITFRHNIFVSDNNSGGTIPPVNTTVFNINFVAIGGEDFVSGLFNKKLLMVAKDGVVYSPILTTGTPVSKQVVYDKTSGIITFAIPFEEKENIFVVYQNL